VKDSLIIDVGMHTGRDTEFYLLKGFDVVAVEANPALAERARERFADAMKEKRLVLHEVAIADHEGEVEFFINLQHDDWGTTSAEFARRNERFGTENTQVRVGCTRFENILRQHGIPYYLKIDIEGADLLCLTALREFEERPKYVSIEAGLTSFEETFDELATLRGLGYRSFKIVNQRLNKRVRCPKPPREGRYVDHRFDATSSGPFGEEAPGRWMSLEETFVEYRRLLALQRRFGAGGRFYKTPVHKLYELITRERVGWYDFHARLAGC